MRKLSIFLALLMMLLSGSLQAADNKTRVVLHLNDGFKLGELDNSVENIRKELGDAVEIKVVINGKAVKRLLRSNIESTEIVNKVLQQDVNIGLCHNALANNRVDSSMLIDGLQVLKTDGNVTVINYQKQGYIYIKL